MNLANWVVVFDLDDTLISELEYQRSGIAAVEAAIEVFYGVPFGGYIQNALEEGVDDLWGWACQKLSLPFDVKDSLLWLYRLHVPSISLASGIRATLDTLALRQAHLSVLTDGRSVTQRLKLSATGLGSIPVFISEDHDSVKPNPDRFIAIENRWPGCRYVYVADNPAKDFLAPNARGWLTLGANWINPRVHMFESLPLEGCQPKYWLHEPVQVIHRIEAVQVGCANLLDPNCTSC